MKDLFKREFTENEIISTIILSIVTIMPLITIKGLNQPFLIGKMVYLYIIGIVLLVFWVKNIKSINICREGIIIAVFGACLTIATIFSTDPIISLLGEDSWEQGLIMYIVYILLFTFSIKCFKINEFKINIMCIFSCVMGIHTILQFYGIDIIVKYYLGIDEPVDMIGTIGNRNLVAIYMVIFVLLSTAVYVFNGKKRYVIYSGILFGALLATLTRGGWVGAAVALFVGLLFVIKEKKYHKRIVIIVCLFLSIFLIMNFTRDNILVSRSKSILYDATNMTENSGSGRIGIWKTTLECIKMDPIIGSGIDSLRMKAIINDVGSTGGFTKAHNEFLDYLVSGGILTLMAYMSLVTIILKNLYKIRESNMAKVFIVIITGYLVQSFFSISVIEVAPIFWIILGSSVKFYKEYDKGLAYELKN